MNPIEFKVDTIEQIIDQIVPSIREASIITFTGPLGAGKTTLIRALLVRLGVDASSISSPTFSYVQEYHASTGLHVYHFDLYRLASVDDFFAMGFEEYLYRPGSIVCIEWPEVVRPLLHAPMCEISLAYAHSLETRIISWRISQ